MNTMIMPGFTAEASLYQTNNHYRCAAGGSFLNDGNTAVIPQDCGLARGIACGGLITLGAAACTAFCFSGPGPCIGCWTIYLGGLYGTCRDCIPGWMRALIDLADGGGNGGNGGGPSCPSGCCSPNRCCEMDANGKCRPGMCIGPGMQCH
jgi:hypothetical protein